MTISSFPVKVKNPKIKIRHFNFLVFDISDQYTILERRKDKDIWQNLFQFPLYESAYEIDYKEIIKTNTFNDLIGKCEYKLQIFNSKPIIHRLTHQHIYTNFWIIIIQSHLKGAVEWENISNFAVPTLIYNFIDKFKK